MMKTFVPLFAAVAMVTVAAMPASALAQRRYDRYDTHRQAQKDQWKGLAVVGGVVGLVGAATHNPGLAAIGAAGAVYSGVRYAEDREGDYGYGRPYGGYRRDDRVYRDRDVYVGYGGYDRGGYGTHRVDNYRYDDRRDDRHDYRDRDSRRDDRNSGWSHDRNDSSHDSHGYGGDNRSHDHGSDRHRS